MRPKQILLALLVLSLQLRLTADTLLLSYGVTNRIALSDGEVLRFDKLQDTGDPISGLVKKGAAISIFQAIIGNCVAGPSEVVFTWPVHLGGDEPINATSFTTTKFSNSSMHTVILGKGETNKLTIGAGKAFTLYSGAAGSPSDGRESGVFAVRDSFRARVGNYSGWYVPVIVHGPLLIEMVGYTDGPINCPVGNQNDLSCAFPRKLAVTYAISDLSVTGLPSGSVEVPSGPATLAIEKSTDLINWEPSVLQTIQVPDEKAFFRLRVDR